MKIQITSFKKITLLLLAGISIFSSENTSNSQLLEYNLAIRFVVLNEKAWHLSMINAQIRKLTKVFEQCQLSVKNIPVEYSQFINFNPDLIQHHVYQQKGSEINKISDFYQSDKFINIFLFGDTQKNITAFSYNEMMSKRYSHKNTVWISSLINSKEYKQDVSQERYDVIAHEIAHVILNEPYHNLELSNNILSITSERSNHLSDEQCDTIFNSPFIYPSF